EDRNNGSSEEQIPRVARNDEPGVVVAAKDQELEQRKPKRRRKVKTCEYLRLDGTVCGSQAESDGFCGCHLRWWTLVEEGTGMQCPEDRESLRLMLQETMARVIGGEMSFSKADAVVKICWV